MDPRFRGSILGTTDSEVLFHIFLSHLGRQVENIHDPGVTGRHALRERARNLGFQIDADKLDTAFDRFKELADKKKDIYDGDLESIVMNAGSASSGPWTF